MTINNQTNATISWQSSTDSGGSGLAGYKVYRDGILIRKIPQTFIGETGLSQGTTYCWSVSAYDGAGNNSPRSPNSCATTGVTPEGTVNLITRIGGVSIGNTGSCVATILTPTGNSTAGCSKVLISQPAGTYSVQWNGGYPSGADTTIVPSVSAPQSLIGSGTVNLYLDFKGPTNPGTVNLITRIGGVKVILADPCVASVQSPAGSNTAGCSRVLTSQPVGLYSVQWYHGYPPGADTTIVPVISPSQNLFGGGSIDFYIDFRPSSTDTIPPAFPSRSRAVLENVNNIRFSWADSIDNAGGSGVAGYNVYRDNLLRETITATSTYDDALPPNTTFCWSVAALDKAGNTSARTPNSCVTTGVVQNNSIRFFRGQDVKAKSTVYVYNNPGGIYFIFSCRHSRYGNTSRKSRNICK